MQRRLSSPDASLDRPERDGDGERTRGDSLRADRKLGPDLQTEEQELAALVRRELAIFRHTLEGRDAAIFDARVTAESRLTLAELADRFCVSRERIRQLEDRLKSRLRAHLRLILGDAVPSETKPYTADIGRAVCQVSQIHSHSY